MKSMSTSQTIFIRRLRFSTVLKAYVYLGIEWRLRVLRILIRPLAGQHDIVRRVEALFRLADAIEKRVAAPSAGAEFGDYVMSWASLRRSRASVQYFFVRLASADPPSLVCRTTT